MYLLQHQLSGVSERRPTVRRWAALMTLLEVAGCEEDK